MAKTAKKKPVSSTRKRRSSSVPGSYRGFSYQGTRFLFHLLKSPRDSCVCLEVFEDVGVELPSGQRVAEQNKNYLSRNPLSTRAPSLWKSLRNWVEDIIAGRLVVDSTFFVLCAPGAVPCDIAERFDKALTQTDAQLAIAFAKQTLEASESDEKNQNADISFVLSHSEELAKVVAHLAIETPLLQADELKPLFLDKLVSEDAYDDVVRWAHGWVKTTVDAELTAARPARVRVNDFREALLNYVRVHDRLDILRSYAGIPATEEVKKELAFRDYVRQLQLIQLEDEGVLEAVNDYLRAVVDRTNWAERGFVDEKALDTFADNLSSTWRNLKRRTFLTHADKLKENQGQLLYSDCIEHHALLDGFEPPKHFVKGSFHALADERSIGWHPDFSTLLPQPMKTKSADGEH